MKSVTKGIVWGLTGLIIVYGLTACGQQEQVSYDERIEAEINRMIADGELIDNTVDEAFDEEAQKIIEDMNIEDIFNEKPEENEPEEENDQGEQKVEFVESNGPDEIVIDDVTYHKIGKNFAPGTYIFEGTNEYDSFFVVMDNDKHDIVNSGGGWYDVFDTMQGQYITYDENTKVYPISQAAEVKKNENGGYPEGTYVVGTQIPAGEYVARGDYASLTASKYPDGNDAHYGYCGHDRSAIIKVEEGEYLTCDFGELFPLEATADLKPSDGIYKDGTYKVGFHIPTGTYKLSADAESAYVEIYNDAYMKSGRGDESVEALKGADTTFSIKEGQYIMIYGGEVVAQ